MQENNFEKQVQEKASELKLKPSEEVWQKVSLAIAKRKTDRKIFAFALLLLLFTSAAIFVIWHPATESKTGKDIAAKESTETKHTDNPINSNKNSKPEPNAAASKATDNKNTVNKAVDLKKDNQQNIQPGASSSVDAVTKKSSPGIIKHIDQYANQNKGNQLGPRFNHNKLNAATGGKTKVRITGNEPGELAQETVKADKVTTDMSDSLTTIATTIDQQLRDTVSDEKNITAKPLTDTRVTSSLNKTLKETVAKKSSSSRSHKWTVGLRLSGGIAATKSGYFGIGPGSGNEEKAYSDPAQSNNGSGGGSGGQAATYFAPSTVKTGKGFMAGVYARKNMGTKVSLLIGLNYKTYSSSLSTGERVDSNLYYNFSSNASFFYRSGTKVQYTNHFYFIELPVLLRYRLGKQTKLPVYVEAGINLSRLMSSNVLQFNALYGSYYKDTEPLNKTMVGVSAGLLFSLSGNSPHPFLIGPEINFSLNKMASHGLYENRRYSYFGLQVQKVFGKK